MANAFALGVVSARCVESIVISFKCSVPQNRKFFFGPSCTVAKSQLKDHVILPCSKQSPSGGLAGFQGRTVRLALTRRKHQRVVDRLASITTTTFVRCLNKKIRKLYPSNMQKTQIQHFPTTVSPCELFSFLKYRCWLSQNQFKKSSLGKTLGSIALWKYIRQR